MGERLLRLQDVMARIGVRRSTIYREIQKGNFPVPRKIGRASVWPESEIQGWVDSLSQQGGKDQAR